MAFSTLKQCRSTVQGPFSIRSLATSTTPKLAASVAAAGAVPQRAGLFKGMLDTVRPAWPVLAILAGMVAVAGSIGIHTAKQQFLHSPSVQVTKKKRECMPEVDYPDAVIRSADKFETKSFLRKVAHIQDNKHTPNMGPDRYTRSRECETLKSVGVRN